MAVDIGLERTIPATRQRRSCRGDFLRPNDRPLQGNYAVPATDDGHQASPLDGSWAIGHPEKVKAFLRNPGLSDMQSGRLFGSIKILTASRILDFRILPKNIEW